MASRPPGISPFRQAWLKWKALPLPWRKRFFIGLDLGGNTYWEFRETARAAHTQGARMRRIVCYPSGTHHGDVRVPPLWHQWLRHTRAAAPSLDEQRAEVARQERMRLLAAQADARWEAKPRLAGGADGRGGGGGAGERGPAGLGSWRGDASAEDMLRELQQQQQQQQQQLGQLGQGQGLGQGLGQEHAAPTPEGRSVRGGRDAGKGGDAEGVRDGVDASAGAAASPGASTGAGGEPALREKTWRRMQREASASPKAAAPNPWKQAHAGPSEAWQPQAWQPPSAPPKRSS